MKTIKVLIVIVGLALAYLKTTEAMVRFAPHSFMGFTDPSLPYAWAVLSAALVEGVAIVAFANLRNARKDSPTKGISWTIAILAVGFSIIMNLIDQAINSGSFNDGAGSPLGGLLYNLMGLIPIIVAVAFGIMEIVDAKITDKGGRGGGGGGGGGNQNMFRQQPYQEIPETYRQLAQGQGNNGPAPVRAQASTESIAAPAHNPVFTAKGAGNGNGKTFGNDLGEMPSLVDRRHPSHLDPTSPA